jgi:hypothetical protein
MARFAPPRALPSFAALAAVMASLVLASGSAQAESAVYKWVDGNGVTHLSSERPPAGVRYERMAVASSLSSQKNSSKSRAAGSASSTARVATASPEQVARRTAVVNELQNRECVVSLEAINRLARNGAPVDPQEFERLQQTADRTCSQDPATRRQQEEAAARLRVARGDTCVDARNKLADMLEPGQRPTREQLKTQQEFIESHCTPPVR